MRAEFAIAEGRPEADPAMVFDTTYSSPPSAVVRARGEALGA
jgi:hypothetical protein